MEKTKNYQPRSCGRVASFAATNIGITSLIVQQLSFQRWDKWHFLKLCHKGQPEVWRICSGPISFNSFQAWEWASQDTRRYTLSISWNDINNHQIPSKPITSQSALANLWVSWLAALIAWSFRTTASMAPHYVSKSTPSKTDCWHCLQRSQWSTYFQGSGMLTSIRICSTHLLNYAQGPIDTHQEIISGYVWREFWLHQWNLVERTCFMSPCHTSIEKCNSSIFMPYELIKMSDRYFKTFNIIELGWIRSFSIFCTYAHIMKTKTNASVEGHLRCNRVHLRTARAVRGLRCHKLCGIAFILMLLSTTTTSITTTTTTTTTTKTKTQTKTLYSYYVYYRGTSAPKAIIYLI